MLHTRNYKELIIGVIVYKVQSKLYYLSLSVTFTVTIYPSLTKSQDYGSFKEYFGGYLLQILLRYFRLCKHIMGLNI